MPIKHFNSACAECFEEVFGASISYGADDNRLNLDKALIKTRLATAHPEPGNFTRAFKRRTGKAPTEFRTPA